MTKILNELLIGVSGGRPLEDENEERSAILLSLESTIRLSKQSKIRV